MEKFNRSSLLPLGLTLLATHFARLRSRYRLIDGYNNDRLLYIHRAPGSISLETDRIAVARHYSNLVTNTPYEIHIRTNSLYSLCIRASRINPRVTTRRDNPDPETFLLLTSENIEVDSIDFRSLRNGSLRYEAEEILIDRDGEKCLARRYPRLSSHALLPTGHFPRPTRSA